MNETKVIPRDVWKKFFNEYWEKFDFKDLTTEDIKKYLGEYLFVALPKDVTDKKTMNPWFDEMKVFVEKGIAEKDFYQPFAEWLVKLGECTRANRLGGNTFKDKWFTPDVIGVRAPHERDVIKLPTDVVSAEIKIDTKTEYLIIGFGQACSYKLFSHKSYLVIPKESSKENIERLDASCRILGIGLILFNNSSPKIPDFEIRVRATRHEPDMLYLNKNLKPIQDVLFP